MLAVFVGIFRVNTDWGLFCIVNKRDGIDFEEDLRTDILGMIKCKKSGIRAV